MLFINLDFANTIRWLSIFIILLWHFIANWFSILSDLIEYIDMFFLFCYFFLILIVLITLNISFKFTWSALFNQSAYSLWLVHHYPTLSCASYPDVDICRSMINIIFEDLDSSSYPSGHLSRSIPGWKVLLISTSQKLGFQSLLYLFHVLLLCISVGEPCGW